MVAMPVVGHAPTGDLHIRPGRGLPRGLVIPAAELTERFSRASGPGGQSVNTADSRVEVSWNVETSAVLSDEQRARLLEGLESRLSGGVLTVAASEHRTQLRNRVAARTRLAGLIANALPPPTMRRATRPTRASRERRLDAKKRRSDIKAGRRRFHAD